ncbi:MAG TPA: sigma-70 family RNA polymerase sigma factor [Anaerolineae bacterium]|nr:sigma-70 family RNA polymerase sigma factor [Anaerolineae bacterium]
MNKTQQKKIFDQWLHEYPGIFYKIVRSHAFTPADQDDLFQEISLQVWQSIPNFRGESKPSTWIYRVALYAAAAWVRQEKKQPTTSPLGPIEHTLITSQQQDERLNWLYHEIGQLEPLDRSICLLMLEGYTYQEIADLIGISASNVGVKIHRLKTHLQRKSMELQSHEI